MKQRIHEIILAIFSFTSCNIFCTILFFFILLKKNLVALTKSGLNLQFEKSCLSILGTGAVGGWGGGGGAGGIALENADI